MKTFATLGLVCLVIAGCSRASAPVATAFQPARGTTFAAPDVSLRKDIVPMIKMRCSQCHGGWILGTGEPNTARLKHDLNDIILRVEHGNMPKDKPGSVTTAEIAALKAWQASGAPDN
jgi:hypothetical protein